jgi:hypothetical protein
MKWLKSLAMCTALAPELVTMQRLRSQESNATAKTSEIALARNLMSPKRLNENESMRMTANRGREIEVDHTFQKKNKRCKRNEDSILVATETWDRTSSPPCAHTRYHFMRSKISADV